MVEMVATRPENRLLRELAESDRGVYLKLVRQMEPFALQSGAMLGLPRAIADFSYFIESGTLRAFILDDGEEQIIRFGYQNNLITAIDCFITGKPSELYIQAIKKTVIRIIPKNKITAFIGSSAENQKMWTSVLESLVVQQLEREIDILTTSPKERYERVLKRSPQLFQEVPSKYIANYLRMSAETLSRLKKS